jgi:hypothetical protein
MKVILCHKSLDKSFYFKNDWSIVETNNRIAIDKTEIKKAIPGATGGSWSTQLLQQNPGSRWITFRGNKVLIRGNADGTATIVFSGNPAHEHLKIVPKEHFDYAKIKDEKSKQPRATKTEQEVTEQKQVEKTKKQKQQRIKNQFKQQINDLFKDQKKELNFDQFKDLDSNKQKETVKELIDHAKKKILKDTIKDTAFSDLQQTPNKIESENPVIHGMTMDTETALQIAGLDIAHKEAMKDKKDVDLTDYLSKQEAVDITEKILSQHENRLRALNNTSFYNLFDSKQRTKQISKELLKGSKAELNSISNLALNGGGLSDEMISFLGINNATKLLAGAIDQSGKLEKTKNDLEKILSEKSKKVVEKTLNDYNSKANIIEAYKKQARDVFDEDGNLSEPKMISSATSSVNIMKIGKEQNKNLGVAVGSLQTAASLLENLNQVSESKDNIIVDGGNSKRSLNYKLNQLGLTNHVAVKQDKNNRFQIHIDYDKFKDILKNKESGIEADNEVRDIKDGKFYKRGKEGLAKGQPETYVDFIDQNTYQKHNEELNHIRSKQANGENLSPEENKLMHNIAGYSPYTNQKGQKGYTSQYPEGTILFGKEKESSLGKHQQQSIQMLHSQKRFIMDFGAGTGKTMAHLANISDLKHTGKLQNPAVISPPSRLVKEFFKDQEKFFPNLKMLNIDDIKGGIEEKKKAILNAKENGYDVIISGHDSIKSGLQKGGTAETYAYSKMKKLGKILSKPSNLLTTKEKKEIKDYKDVWVQPDGNKKLRAVLEQEFHENKGIPELIASIKPFYLGVDEAHEVWGENTDSARSGALQKLSDSAEYFVPSTGTLMRSGIGDFAKLMNITRPDLVPSVEKFKDKWGKDISGNLTENTANNQMAKDTDKGILTYKSEITPKKIKNADSSDFQKLDLSLNQKIEYANNENMYDKDRTFNKRNDLKRSFGVWDKEKNKLVTHDNGEIKDLEHLRNNMSLNVSNDDKPSPQALAELKNSGYSDTERFKLVQLGGTGASARRDSMHKKTVNNGKAEHNTKVQAMLKNIEDNPDQNHGVLYVDKKSKDTITEGLKSKGFEEGDIAYIDSDNTKDQNNKNLAAYMQGKKKILVGSQVAMTGLNIQKMDNIHYIGVPNSYNLEQQSEARAWRKGRENYATESNPNADVKITHYNTNTTVDNNARFNIDKQRKEAERIKQYKKDYSLADEALQKSLMIKKANENVVMLDNKLGSDSGATGLTALKKETMAKFKAIASHPKVQKVMKEFKAGTLKDKSGKTITNRKQAVAIALSQAKLSKGLFD